MFIDKEKKIEKVLQIKTIVFFFTFALFKTKVITSLEFKSFLFYFTFYEPHI